VLTLTYMPPDHVPVLAAELIGLLDPQPDQTVVDCTFGAGGHARLVAERIAPGGELIAIDRDPAAAERFEELESEAPSAARFIRGDYADALVELADEGLEPDAIYFDLGVSSMQVDAWERGFSYAYDAPLDMRMDPEAHLTAADLVNEWPESRLSETIRRYGEEQYARRIAAEIVRRRPLETTSELVEAIRDAVPPKARFGRGHPAKRTFQALRIALNEELESLDRALPVAWSLLPPGGRLAAISFHSLEDRRVKRFIADLARGCVCSHTPEAEPLSRRAIAPSPGEIADNPRSRSAHLRGARKLTSDEREEQS
jgi:16S rRNA (cytosine1402-N4)-methyltransferase